MSKGIIGFVGKLATHDRGVIVLCNILDGLGEGLYDDVFVRELLDWWAAFYMWRIRSAGGPKTKEEECEMLLGSLNLLIFRPQPPGFRPGRTRPDFLLRSSRSLKINEVGIKVLHILRSELVYDVFLAPAARRRVGAVGSMALHRAPGIKTKRGVKLWTTDFGVGQRLGLDGEVVYLTDAQGLKEIMASPNMASMARDILGLVQHREGTDLVALGFHCPILGQSNFARPTFADAGRHSRFRTSAERASNIANRTWGFTVDLERFKDAQAELDGLPERVSSPIAFRDLVDIELVPLGKVAGTRGNMSNKDDDSGFARRLRGKRSVADIATAIQGVL